MSDFQMDKIMDNTFQRVSKIQNDVTEDLSSTEDNGEFQMERIEDPYMPMPVEDGSESQLIVDIGSLRQLHHSKANIKELSNMMALKITELLQQEIDLIKQEDKKKLS